MGARELEKRAREALVGATAEAGPSDRAAVLADEAVRLAEELDDPLLLAGALDARLRTHAGPQHLDARLGTSLRLVAVVRQVPDPGVRLEAHLWRLSTALEQLDLSTVRRQLAALDVLADETGDPTHRYYACGRRAMFALTEGDTVGAARLATEASEASGAAAGAVPRAGSVLQTLRAELARQRGERTALVEHAGSCEERGQAHGSASLLGQAAVLWLEGGEPERARRIVDQLAPAVGALRRDADWLLVMCKIGEAAAGSGRTALAARCAGLVAPYAGRAVLDGRAASFAGVVDDYLAVATREREHAARARAAYRRLGADWWSRRGLLGQLYEPLTDSEAPRVLHLHPTSDDDPAGSWCVGRDGAERTVPAMPGFVHLRLLVGHPGTDVPAHELGTDDEGTGAGPGSGRAAIRRAIRTALARLELHDGDVARELRTTIRTGTTYRYEPDPFRPVQWRLAHAEHAHAARG